MRMCACVYTLRCVGVYWDGRKAHNNYGTLAQGSDTQQNCCSLSDPVMSDSHEQMRHESTEKGETEKVRDGERVG